MRLGTLFALVMVAFGVGFAIDQFALERPPRTFGLAASGVLAQHGDYDLYGADSEWHDSSYSYFQGREPLYSEQYYYGPYELAPSPHYNYDYEPGYLEPNVVYVRPDPWYVHTFPGIGRVAQHIIPGQMNRVLVTAPALSLAPQPSCWIAANPMQVSYGGTSVLSWSSFNASRAMLTNIGSVPSTGSYTLRNLTTTQMYTLQVSGAGGSNVCYTRVTVAAPKPSPSCVISVFPSAIARGSSAALSWGSFNAAVATLGGVGVVPLQGGITVSPLYSTDYTLIVSSGEQSKTCTTQLTVQ